MCVRARVYVYVCACMWVCARVCECELSATKRFAWTPTTRFIKMRGACRIPMSACTPAGRRDASEARQPEAGRLWLHQGMLPLSPLLLRIRLRRCRYLPARWRRPLPLRVDGQRFYLRVCWALRRRHDGEGVVVEVVLMLVG